MGGRRGSPGRPGARVVSGGQPACGYPYGGRYVSGVAEIETDDDSDGEWVITWLATGLTVEQVEALLDGLDFGAPAHVMG